MSPIRIARTIIYGMNCFQLIKTVLDEAYAEIPGTEDEKDAAIQKQMKALSNALFANMKPGALLLFVGVGRTRVWFLVGRPISRHQTSACRGDGADRQRAWDATLHLLPARLFGRWGTRCPMYRCRAFGGNRRASNQRRRTRKSEGMRLLRVAGHWRLRHLPPRMCLLLRGPQPRTCAGPVPRT